MFWTECVKVIASSPGANQGQAPVVYIITQQDTDHAAC